MPEHSTNLGGPSPRLAVWSECLHTAGSLAISPFSAVPFLLLRKQLSESIGADLAHQPEVEDPGTELELPSHPLRIFVSCAEPSGETHGLNLVRALLDELARRDLPPPVLFGLGSRRMADLGVRTVGDPVGKAAMGAAPLRALPFYGRILRDAATLFRAERPDVCIPVDSPALHVPLGRIAHRYGIPVVHFVTPQYWAWAPWRVRAYRHAVDLALTILPFEAAWFPRHDVASRHVGHPHLDELLDVPVGADDQRSTVVLLPGSRRSVIDRNLPWMIVAAARMRLAVPDAEVVLPHGRPELREALEGHVRAAGAEEWIRIAAGDLHRELARARVALSVSGTVLIDLLHHRVPCSVVYRLRNAASTALSRHVLTVPWFSSINLLAGREIVPEHCFHGTGPLDEVADFLARVFQDGDERARIRDDMDAARARLGPPGATTRAARHALSLAASRRRSR